MPSHPPTLLTLTARSVEKNALFTRGDRVVVAVSGGPDSMALLHVLARLRTKLGHELVAHGVDHGLRAEATTELDRAEALAGSLGVAFARTRVSVPRGGNLQARARDARYGALIEAATKAGARTLATAHHADDRAETVLIRLLRGAGPVGLAVLPPRAPSPHAAEVFLVRPFLDARRAAIEAHLARHGVPFAQDPSNRDPRYLRTRVRHELLPLLTELSPSIVTHLCALADQLLSSADGTPIFPRATRDALVALARTRSAKARVLLPGGLVASYDRPQLRKVAPSARRRT